MSKTPAQLDRELAVMASGALTPAQAKALRIAAGNTQGDVYAGWNPGGGGYVGANTLRSLARLGLVVLEVTSAGETCGRLTAAGASAARPR